MKFLISAETPRVNDAAYITPESCASQCTEEKYPFFAAKFKGPGLFRCLCVTKVLLFVTIDKY